MLAGLPRFTRTPTLLLQHGRAHSRAALRMDLKTYKPIAKVGKKQTRPDAAAAVAAEDDAPAATKAKKSTSAAAAAGESKSPKAKKPKLEVVTEQSLVARAPRPAGDCFTVRALPDPSCFSCNMHCAFPVLLSLTARRAVAGNQLERRRAARTRPQGSAGEAGTVSTQSLPAGAPIIGLLYCCASGQRALTVWSRSRTRHPT